MTLLEEMADLTVRLKESQEKLENSLKALVAARSNLTPEDIEEIRNNPELRAQMREAFETRQQIQSSLDDIRERLNSSVDEPKEDHDQI